MQLKDRRVNKNVPTHKTPTRPITSADAIGCINLPALFQERQRETKKDKKGGGHGGGGAVNIKKTGIHLKGEKKRRKEDNNNGKLIQKKREEREKKNHISESDLVSYGLHV